jgi:hypothetical protein
VLELLDWSSTEQDPKHLGDLPARLPRRAVWGRQPPGCDLPEAAAACGAAVVRAAFSRTLAAMLPSGTRFLGAAPPDRETARTYARLARLLPNGAYHAERSPEKFVSSNTTPLHAEASHTLPIGWEQRVERPGGAGSSSAQATMCRIFFIDHTSRATTLVDPRVAGAGCAAEPASDADGATDAHRELLLLASGVLPEQVVSPSDFRAALHRALRQSLSGLHHEGPAGGLRERRLQLQQHVGRALLERYLGAGRAPDASASDAIVRSHRPQPRTPRHPPPADTRHAAQLAALALHSSHACTREPRQLHARPHRRRAWHTRAPSSRRSHSASTDLPCVLALCLRRTWRDADGPQALFARKHAHPPPQALDQHVMSSLQKHASHTDLLALYTSGLFGPKRRHIWRVHNRLDMIPPAALRNYTGPFSTGARPERHPPAHGRTTHPRTAHLARSAARLPRAPHPHAANAAPADRAARSPPPLVCVTCLWEGHAHSHLRTTRTSAPLAHTF